jgi:phage baseplate assembly protein W
MAGTGYYIAAAQDGTLSIRRGTAGDRVKGAILMTLLTLNGEIPGRFLKGSDIPRFVFEPQTDVLPMQISIALQEALSILVPDVAVDGVQYNVDEENDHMGIVTVYYHWRTAPGQEQRFDVSLTMWGVKE